MRSLTTRSLVFAAAFFLFAYPAYTQQSAFQSGDGRTSVYLDSGAAIFNFTDTKLSIGYTNRHSARNVFFGYEVFGKASSGVTTLFSEKAKIPEGGADFVVGSHDPFHWSRN